MKQGQRVGIGVVLGAFLGIVAFQDAARAEKPLRKVIDAQIEAAWKKVDVSPAGPATDAEFLRRVYLDLLGTIPTYDETIAFLENDASDKRAQLIDRLLEDPRHAVHQARIWDRLYFGREPADSRARKRDGFKNWLRQQFADNVPYDKMAAALLKAEGNTVEHGAPMYLFQFARKPLDAVVDVSETFLGIQLQCARCHDHPYEDWSQRDFYGMAAFFCRLETVKVGKKDGQTQYAVGEKSTGEIKFTGPSAEQEAGQKGEPIPAKFLKGDTLEEPALPDDFEEPRRFPSGEMPPEPQFSRKDALAAWITSDENPWFAGAVANRIWAQFMGRGLVHPVDNQSMLNPPSHPELLQKLGDRLIAHDFDLKWYIRELCNSRTYQLSGRGATDEARPRWFQRARVRPLSAEELAAAWRIATGYADAHPEKRKEDDPFWGLTSGYMLRFFGEPSDGVGHFQGGLHEHLYLNNGQVHRLIARSEGGLHHAISQSEAPWPQRVERLFLSTLNRRPEPVETEKFVAYLSTEDDASRRLEEAIWTLVTCSEFRFNH